MLLTLAAAATLENPSGKSPVTGFDNVMQFIVVAVLFILVLLLTALTTRWIAKYQKGQFVNRNIEVIDTYRIAGNKYIQIVRIGETYLAIAVGKDDVSVLAEIPKEQIRLLGQGTAAPANFKAVLEKARILKSGKDDEAKKE